jgi:hypothetical protein
VYQQEQQQQEQEQQQQEQEQQQDAENPFLDPPFSRIKTSFLIIRLICLRGCLFEQWFDFVRATINFAIV